MVKPVPVVLESHCPVLLRNAQLLDFILLKVLEEGSISKHLGHLQLMLVPILCEARFHVAL